MPSGALAGAGVGLWRVRPGGGGRPLQVIGFRDTPLDAVPRPPAAVNG